MLGMAVVTVLLTAFSVAGRAAGIERKQLLNEQWQFVENDSDFTRARSVTLPHDWSIAHGFSRDTPAGNEGAYLPTGKGWYRKVLTLGKDYKDKKVRLYFEGVYMNSRVYVNGHEAGGWPYGYSSFWVDATPYVTVGRNEIVVSVDNSQQKNCRWYTGSGIYRNVWLVTTPKTYIDDWSIQVTTPDVHHVQISATVVGEDGSTQAIQRSIEVANPRLWSPSDPYLYEAVLEAPGGDRVSVSYGIRTIEYDAERGLLLNGQPLKLNGACVHHDNGVLGAAAYDDAEYRKARLMKEAGFNAVRTAHNPPSEAFLTACDQLGLLVIDESFDGWREKKNDYDYSTLIDTWWQRDIDAMVCRDRLHPSIFCWSIGNEVIERKQIEVVKTAHQMATRIHSLDAQNRPVTSALAAWDSDWDIYDPLAAEHDIVGYNYMIFKAESDHERVPQRVMMQTESFPRDAWRNYRWTMDHSYIVGDFVWTGLDYLGESGAWPSRGLNTGLVDFAGFLKPRGHFRRALWAADPVVYIGTYPDRQPRRRGGEEADTTRARRPWLSMDAADTWNYDEGQNIRVVCYTNTPQARLLLKRAATPDSVEVVGEMTPYDASTGMISWAIPYAAGELVCEGCDAQGNAVARYAIRTSGDAVRLRATLLAQSATLAQVLVEAVDAEGERAKRSMVPVTCALGSGARLLGMENALNFDMSAPQAPVKMLGQGRLVAYIALDATPATVTFTAEGLEPATLNLRPAE